MRSNITFVTIAWLAAITVLSACSQDSLPSIHTSRSGNEVMAGDIPASHTPPGGYGNTFPPSGPGVRYDARAHRRAQ